METVNASYVYITYPATKKHNTKYIPNNCCAFMNAAI